MGKYLQLYNTDKKVKGISDSFERGEKGVEVKKRFEK